MHIKENDIRTYDEEQLILVQIVINVINIILGYMAYKYKNIFLIEDGSTNKENIGLYVLI